MAGPDDRESVLAAASPTALFGEGAGDALSLRRAYAALARVWRDDDEVTRHVRALYEQARAAVETAASAPTVDDTGTPVPSPLPPADVSAQLMAALEARDAPRLLALLRNHADPLVLRHSALVIDALSFLVYGVGEHLGPDALDAVALVTARPDLDAPPHNIEALEIAIETLRALFAAEADPEVAQPLCEAVRKSWFHAPVSAARVWVWLRGELAAQQIDLDAAFHHLERHHPALFGALQRAEIRMAAGGEERLPPAEARAVLREELPPTSELLAKTGAAQATLAPALLLAVLFGAYVCGAPRALIVGMFTGGIYPYFIGPLRTVAKVQRRIEALTSRGNADLLALAEQEGLWPGELARALVPQDVVPRGNAPAYPQDHPLQQLRSDPTALLRCIGSAHIARLTPPEVS